LEIIVSAQPPSTGSASGEAEAEVDVAETQLFGGGAGVGEHLVGHVDADERGLRALDRLPGDKPQSLLHADWARISWWSTRYRGHASFSRREWRDATGRGPRGWVESTT
jgi:hypothetical protein